MSFQPTTTKKKQTNKKQKKIYRRSSDCKSYKSSSSNAGDPTIFGNLRASPETINAVRNALNEGRYNGYAHSAGIPEARQAVCDYIEPYQGKVTVNDIILCSGCSSSIDLCISVLGHPGSNILVPRPGFSIYRTLALSYGIEIRSYNLLPDRQWEVDLHQMDQLINRDTVAIVLTNPSNPCGSVFTAEHIQRILDIAERHRVPIIADEIYEHFVFPNVEYCAVSSLSTNVPVLSCGGLTKRFLVPGWRLGWIVVHDRNDVLRDVRKVMRDFIRSSPNTDFFLHILPFRMYPGTGESEHTYFGQQYFGTGSIVGHSEEHTRHIFRWCYHNIACE